MIAETMLLSSRRAATCPPSPFLPANQRHRPGFAAAPQTYTITDEDNRHVLRRQQPTTWAKETLMIDIKFVTQ